ncbi:MAG: hypothetical protein AAB653_01470 [Patescibacteria group bacterium]
MGKKTERDDGDNKEIEDIPIPEVKSEKEIFLTNTVKESNLKNKLQSLESENNPNDNDLKNDLKKELKDVLFSNYLQLMRDKAYFDAIHRAEEMLKLEKENTPEFFEKKKLLVDSLCLDYKQLMKEENTILANQRKQQLKKLGIEL